MSNKNKISAVIISLNEEAHIEECIQSILPITDDIVLVDSGSTDNTINIAKKYKVNIHQIEWLGYGGTKNYGNQKAQNDWILSIDADEVISEELRQSILSCDLNDDHVYQIKSLVNFDGHWVKYCGWHPDWKYRLFNKRQTEWDLTAVHENLIHLDKFKASKLDGNLLHYSYDTIEDLNYKTAKYAQLKAEKWHNEGRNIGRTKRMLGPAFAFIKTYIIKRGFLDGQHGYLIAQSSARTIRLALAHFKKIHDQ